MKAAVSKLKFSEPVQPEASPCFYFAWKEGTGKEQGRKG